MLFYLALIVLKWASPQGFQAYCMSSHVGQSKQPILSEVSNILLQNQGLSTAFTIFIFF